MFVTAPNLPYVNHISSIHNVKQVMFVTFYSAGANSSTCCELRAYPIWGWWHIIEILTHRNCYVFFICMLVIHSRLFATVGEAGLYVNNIMLNFPRKNMIFVLFSHTHSNRKALSKMLLVHHLVNSQYCPLTNYTKGIDSNNPLSVFIINSLITQNSTAALKRLGTMQPCSAFPAAEIDGNCVLINLALDLPQFIISTKLMFAFRWQLAMQRCHRL